MEYAASMNGMAFDQNRRIAEVVDREESRLRAFVRRRVPDARDVEDVLQEVFVELVEANRLLMPIDHVGAWLFRVARNRIVDLFRKKRPERFEGVEQLLPSPDAGPEARYARSVLLDELTAAIDELPPEQRAAFVGHELEGRSFREMSEATGVAVNTLLSRKHYAVLRLRERLRDLYEDYNERGGEP